MISEDLEQSWRPLKWLYIDRKRSFPDFSNSLLAVTEALHHLGLRRVVVTSPYPDSHHEAERVYLAQAGIEAIAMHGMGLETGQAFATVPPAAIAQFALEAWDNSADGLFISCMNFDALPAVQVLEERLGKPVVTSHAATLWRVLALAGIDTPIGGYGRLLAQASRCTAVAAG